MFLKLVETINSLGKILSKPAPSFHRKELLLGIIGTILVYFIVYMRGKNSKKYRKNIEYGSARWGKAEDIKPYVDPKPENNVILTQTESLTMNSRPKNPKYARNKNVLIVGGSGSGKTRFWLKPNLMQCHSSYVITDLKECYYRRRIEYQSKIAGYQFETAIGRRKFSRQSLNFKKFKS